MKFNDPAAAHDHTSLQSEREMLVDIESITRRWILRGGCVCVCVCEREREREREREKESVCVRERESECVCVSACLPAYIHVCVQE